MADNEIMLNVNGKYLIRISDDLDVVGIFKGYFSLGSDTALVIEMTGGKIRFIPVGQVVYIDVLEAPKKEEAEEPKKSRDLYYG